MADIVELRLRGRNVSIISYTTTLLDVSRLDNSPIEVGLSCSCRGVCIPPLLRVERVLLVLGRGLGRVDKFEFGCDLLDEHVHTPDSQQLLMTAFRSSRLILSTFQVHMFGLG